MNTAERQADLMRRDRHDPRKTHRFFDDFITMAIDDTTLDPSAWEIIQDAGATGQIGPKDGKGGWFQVYCDGDDNDECYAASRSESFIFNTTAPLLFEARVLMTKGTTDGKSGFILGLSDVVAANSILDAGTLMASFDGALFFKGEDGAYIRFSTSNAATAVNNTTLKAFTDAMTVRLGFYYDPNDLVTAYVTPLVNGIGGTAQALTISGLEEMHILLGVKTFETGNEPHLDVDWVEVIQRRVDFA